MATEMITIELSDLAGDLERIIALQAANHASALPSEQGAADGFVTMRYTAAQLRAMCGAYRHVVAKSDGVVVGYALVMLKECRATFPFLDAMFRDAEAGFLDGHALLGKPYFVMGQVCIDKTFRGKGIFRALYRALREQMRAQFDLVVTEVSTRNARSMAAHRGIGFRSVKDVEDEASEWRVIAWDWS